MSVVASPDVLIVGAGPCGLMAALLLARYGVDFMIIDQLPTRNQTGKSETLQPRTLEVLESLGIRHHVERKGQKVSEYAAYSRDEQFRLRRTRIDPEVSAPTSFRYTLTIDKGDLEFVLEDELIQYGHYVRRSMELVALIPSHSPEGMRTFVRNHIQGTTEQILSKFILGCDGTDSNVRSQANIPVTEFSQDTWLVADVTLSTDFEDIRRRCTIQSIRGNCIFIPRRGGVRIRTLLSAEDLLSGWSDGSGYLTSWGGFLSARVAAAVTPHVIDVKEVSWVKKISVTKFVASSFATSPQKVFLLGNAAYMTSPLTKQGINGGMMDALNLTWKLALFIGGFGSQSLLSTYSSERRGLFLKAMDFDTKADKIFALRGYDSRDSVAFHDFEEASGYTSGCGCRYPPSILVREEVRMVVQEATDSLIPGKRILPGWLIRHIDGNRINALEALGVNCRFKLLLFLGKFFNAPITHGVAGYLSAANSPLLRFKTDSKGSERVIDVFVIHSVPHTTISTHDLPVPFSNFPENIFEDVGNAWLQEIGLPVGGLCLVRPDGYVAIVSNLDDCQAVTEYLEGLL